MGKSRNTDKYNKYQKFRNKNSVKKNNKKGNKPKPFEVAPDSEFDNYDTNQNNV